MIIDDIESLGVRVVEFEPLKLSHSRFKSFRLCIRKADVSKLLLEDFWPEDVVIDRFFWPKNAKRGVTTPTQWLIRLPFESAATIFMDLLREKNSFTLAAKWIQIWSNASRSIGYLLLIKERLGPTHCDRSILILKVSVFQPWNRQSKLRFDVDADSGEPDLFSQNVFHIFWHLLYALIMTESLSWNWLALNVA